MIPHSATNYFWFQPHFMIFPIDFSHQCCSLFLNSSISFFQQGLDNEIPGDLGLYNFSSTWISSFKRLMNMLSSTISFSFFNGTINNSNFFLIINDRPSCSKTQEWTQTTFSHLNHLCLQTTCAYLTPLFSGRQLVKHFSLLILILRIALFAS